MVNLAEVGESPQKWLKILPKFSLDLGLNLIMIEVHSLLETLQEQLLFLNKQLHIRATL